MYSTSMLFTSLPPEYAEFTYNVEGSGLTAAVPFLISLSATPSRLLGGRAAALTVALSSPAGSGGVAVNLSADDPAVAPPSRVFVPEGQRSVTIDVTTTAVDAETTVHLTAEAHGIRREAPLVLTPPRPPATFSFAAMLVAPHTTSGNAERYSLYTPELSLMSETDLSLSPSIAYDYIWFAGQPVAQIDVAPAATHWIFTDHLGTPIIETDATAAVDWRAEYEPYGRVFTYRTGAPRHQPLRLPGQEYDERVPEREYNVFRWYREGWGRYTQDDPLEPGGLGFFSDSGLLTFSRLRLKSNRRQVSEPQPVPYSYVEAPYTYAAANPVGYLDPFGLKVVPCYGGSTGPIPDYARSPGGLLIGECKLLLACADPPRIRLYTETVRHAAPCPPCPGPTDCLAFVDTDTGKAVGKVICSRSNGPPSGSGSGGGW